METFFRWTYPLVSRRPGFVLALIIGVFLLSFGAFSRVEVADEIEGGISDPALLAARQRFAENFAPEQSISIGFEIGGITRESLLDLYDLAREIRRIPQVGRIMSILDLFRARQTREEFAAYLRDFRIDNAKALLASDPVFRGFLVSPGLRQACLVIVPDTGMPGYQKDLYQALQDLLPRLFKGRPYHVSGFIYFKERFFEFVARNNVAFLSLSILVGAVLAFFFFPDLVILLFILLSIAIPAVLTFAVYFYNGNRINMFTAPIVPFALVISLNEIIYLVSFFIGEKALGPAEYAALHEKNYRKLLRPYLINTLTTLIGFLSLSQSPSENIQLFANYTSLACFFSYVIAFAMLFAFLKLYQPPFSGKGRRSFRFRGLGTAIRNVTIRHPGKILAGTLILAVASLGHLGHFESRNAVEDNFRPGEPLLASFEYFRANFCGPYSVQIMLSHDQILSGKYLREIDRFQERLRTVPGINRLFSIVDLVKQFNQTFGAGPDIPDSPHLLRSIVRFFDAGRRSEFFVSSAWNVALVRAYIGISDDFRIAPLGDRILANASETLSPEIRVELTGEVYLNAVLQRNILDNIVWSFAAAFFMIAVVFFVAFRNLTMTFIALVVNFFPIYLAYVLASLAGIPLNASSLVVGCVMSGLVVDDTPHLLTFYLEAGKPGKVRGLVHLVREMVDPVMYSAILMGACNAIFLFSPFKPFQYFGGIGALIVVLGIIGDGILLPAMIMGLTRDRPRAALPPEPATEPGPPQLPAAPGDKS